MRIFLNGNEIGTEELGCAFCGFSFDTIAVFTVNGSFRCAICGKEWRGAYMEVNGRRLFFCCDSCARRFSKVLNEVNKVVDIKLVDQISMFSSTDGREVNVVDINGNRYRLSVRV